MTEDRDTGVRPDLRNLREALDNVVTKITWRPDKTALVHDSEALNTLIGFIVMATSAAPAAEPVPPLVVLSLPDGDHGILVFDHGDGVVDVEVGEGDVRPYRVVRPDVIERLGRALRVAAHSPHDQLGEPNEGFPVCSVCGAIQTAAEPVPLTLDARLITDELGHAIHHEFWGGVAEAHQADSRGDPIGDCYKCRIVRDFIRKTLAALARPEPSVQEDPDD